MKMTFGLNIAHANVKWSNLSAHNLRHDRVFKKSTNKNIKWSLTKYNQIGKVADFNQLMKKQCEPYVKRYNKRQKLEGHKKRCTTVRDYYKKHGKNASRCVVISLGNMKQRNQLENEEAKQFSAYPPAVVKKVLRIKIEPVALKNEMKSFNLRHQHLKFTDYAIHVDEGIIHAHARMVALPTPTGNKSPRPSFSFSKAVREEGHHKDGRQALSAIQNSEAPKALSYLQQALSDNKHHINLQLVHTGNATKLSGNRYKHYAKMKDKDNKETSKASSATSVANSKRKLISQCNSIISSAKSYGYQAGSEANNHSANIKILSGMNSVDDIASSLSQSASSVTSSVASATSSNAIESESLSEAKSKMDSDLTGTLEQVGYSPKHSKFIVQHGGMMNGKGQHRSTIGWLMYGIDYQMRNGNTQNIREIYHHVRSLEDENTNGLPNTSVSNPTSSNEDELQ